MNYSRSDDDKFLTRKEGKGIESARGEGGILLDEMDSKGFTEVSSKQRLKGGERVSHVGIGRKRSPGRGNSQCDTLRLDYMWCIWGRARGPLCLEQSERSESSGR